MNLGLQLRRLPGAANAQSSSFFVSIGHQVIGLRAAPVLATKPSDILDKFDTFSPGAWRGLERALPAKVANWHEHP